MSVGCERVAREAGSRARAGVMRTPHGEMRTPAFITGGTAAAATG